MKKTITKYLPAGKIENDIKNQLRTLEKGKRKVLRK